MDGRQRTRKQLTTDIAGSYLLRDRNIKASVIPYDGEEDGPTAQVSLTVRNTPPPPPRVTIQPAAPLTGEPPVSDADL